jgi:hypothetical protein
VSLNGSRQKLARVILLSTSMFRRGGLKGVMSLQRCPPPLEALFDLSKYLRYGKNISMDLKGLHRRQAALEALTTADNALTTREITREAVLRSLRLDDRQQEVLASGVWDRGVHIVGRLLAARTDGEVFHTVRRKKETDEYSGRQGCRQRADHREETTKENRRDVTVVGLGMITVSRVHEITDWMSKTGRVLESEKVSAYTVASREPDVAEWLMATAFGAHSDRRAKWPLDTVASFDEKEYDEPAQADLVDIARWAESVDSLEHIAKTVGIELEPPVLRTEDLLD